MSKIDQYKLVAVRGGYRWALVARNGAMLCTSAQKFAKRSNAYRAARQARRVAATASVII